MEHEYPRYVFKKDCEPMIVESQEEFEQNFEWGWRYTREEAETDAKPFAKKIEKSEDLE